MKHKFFKIKPARQPKLSIPPLLQLDKLKLNNLSDFRLGLGNGYGLSTTPS
jgi:hypothetical protein